MISNLCYEYLKNYIKNNKIKGLTDYGIESMLVVLQTKFNYDFKINYRANSLKKAALIKYKDLSDNDLKFNVFRRKNLFLAFKDRISQHELFNNLNLLYKKYKIKNDAEQNIAYDITHMILSLLFVNFDDKKIKEEVGNILIDIINKNILSDLKTEAIYFLCLIDSSKVKKEWIEEIKNFIKIHGYLQYYPKKFSLNLYNPANAHHTCLGLLVISEYELYLKKNIVIENFNSKYQIKKNKKKYLFIVILILLILFITYFFIIK
jgi:hypothetical protein